MSAGTRTAIVLATLAVCAALLLGGQALADRYAPAQPSGALTGQVMGRAGFAYLTGLRQFGAALLWNRIDPQMHEYYGGHGLGAMTFTLASIKAITMLDPQFVDAYYATPQVLIDSASGPNISAEEADRRIDEGMQLAKDGVDANPKSGMLLMSYAQLLWTEKGDIKAALPYAVAAMGDDIVWRWDDERWQGMATARALFEDAGDTARAAQARAIMDAISADASATERPTNEDE